MTPLSFPPHPGTVLFCHFLGLFPGPSPCHREDQEAGEGVRVRWDPRGSSRLSPLVGKETNLESRFR